MNLKKGSTHQNFQKKISGGFTLIELLVVVAIIGILASVVLASLNNARTKGADAAIKSNLTNMRGQAEILYSTWGTYAIDATPTYFAIAACTNIGAGADTLFADPSIWAQIVGAYTAGAGAASTRCVSTAAAWAVAAQLDTSDGVSPAGPLPDSWCVDSSGGSKAYTWTAGQTIANSITSTVCS